MRPVRRRPVLSWTRPDTQRVVATKTPYQRRNLPTPATLRLGLADLKLVVPNEFAADKLIHRFVSFATVAAPVALVGAHQRWRALFELPALEVASNGAHQDGAWCAESNGAPPAQFLQSFGPPNVVAVAVSCGGVVAVAAAAADGDGCWRLLVVCVEFSSIWLADFETKLAQCEHLNQFPWPKPRVFCDKAFGFGRTIA